MRRAGIAGLRPGISQDKFSALGETLTKDNMNEMKRQLEFFKSQLAAFAQKHKNDIRKDPVFRAKFHAMCQNCGVDPLASTKGYWATLLGVGDFYYELGVQIVEVCLRTRGQNGGLMELRELCNRLEEKRKQGRVGSKEAVSEDDCLRAIKKLEILGSGFEVLQLGDRRMVRSVPVELREEHNRIMELAQGTGYVTAKEVEEKTGWSKGRVMDALETLMKQSFALVDDGAPDGRRRFYIPCLKITIGDQYEPEDAS
jgi:ESCRT-II complex subunit VPS22